MFSGGARELVDFIRDPLGLGVSKTSENSFGLSPRGAVAMRRSFGVGVVGETGALGLELSSGSTTDFCCSALGASEDLLRVIRG